jgi:hypothetical protein
MAEKRKPTYDLEAFKAAFDNVDKLRVTGAALRGAAALGFGRAEIVATLPAAAFLQVDDRSWESPGVAGRLPRSFLCAAALREITAAP